MPELTYAIIATLIGFAGLVWSADRFVDGSASIAKAAGLSPLIIGLTIVSLGTSAPEILVSINAAFSGAGELAIGNAIGSNLANVGLVLGVTALIATLPVQKHLLQHEMPILAAVTLIAGVCLWDAKLSFWEGGLLISLIIPAIGFLIYIKRGALSPEEKDDEEDAAAQFSTKAAWTWFLIGLALLIVSAKTLVWGATEIATFFEVSPLIIGLTVVAIGTSLPELAASIMSALRGHHDIALGNIIGSNMFNLLAVMPIPALVQPLIMEPSVFYRDFASMSLITALLIALMAYTYLRHKGKNGAGLGKLVGILMLTCYGAYYIWLFQ